MADKAIYSVDTVNSMSDTDKVYVNTGNNIKQISKDDLCGNDIETLKTEVNNNTNAIREVNDSLSALGKCKNLLKTTLGSGNGNGITYINNGDGTYTLNGTCTNTLELHFNPALKLPYGKYKLLGTSAFQKTNNGEWIATLSSGDVFEVSESKPMLDVVAYISSDSVVNETFKPMVTTNLNATVNDFVPYTGDKDTLTADVAKINNQIDAVKEINVPWFFGDDTTLTSTTKSLNHGLDISKITSVFGYCNECYSNQPLLNKSIPYYASGGTTGFDDYGIKYHLDETKIHIEVTRGTNHANNGWFRGGNVRFLLSHKL